jgi:hypothetical protein
MIKAKLSNVKNTTPPKLKFYILKKLPKVQRAKGR